MVIFETIVVSLIFCVPIFMVFKLKSELNMTVNALNEWREIAIRLHKDQNEKKI